MRLGKFRIVDLTQPIFNEMACWPGQLKNRIWTYNTHEETGRQYKMSFQTTAMLLNDHNGTHVDAPNHRDPKGKSIDQIPLERFYTEAVCVDAREVKPDEYVTVEYIQAYLEKTGLTIKKGDTFLLCTGHYEKYTNARLEYVLEPFTGLDRRAAEWLADQGISGFGTDAPAPDGWKSVSKGEFPADVLFNAERGILVFENLCNLVELVGKRFIFIAPPLKIVGSTGSPVRAMAILEET